MHVVASQRVMNLKRAIIIYNPMSGRPGRRAQHARAMTRLLEARGIQTQAFATTGPGDASQLARSAVADGVDIIVSYGGDGTLNEVIQGMPGSRAALAVWPGGTANVVARDIGMPAKIERVADVIAAGKTKRVALGVATGRESSAASRVGRTLTSNPQPLRRYFLMMAGIGIDASIARSVNKKLKRLVGELAYWWCGIKHLLFWKVEPFSIDIDGKRYLSAFALIGKGKGYGGGLTLTPGAKLEAPWFEVYILPPLRNNFSYLRALAACRRGTPEAAGATLIRGTHIRANSAQAPWVEVDGEVIGPLPMTFDVVPDALSIIIP